MWWSGSSSIGFRTDRASKWYDCPDVIQIGFFARPVSAPQIQQVDSARKSAHPMSHASQWWEQAG
jgi:hypothetical protein